MNEWFHDFFVMSELIGFGKSGGVDDVIKVIETGGKYPAVIR